MTSYIHAILPPATKRVLCSMSHEFPPEPISQADERELLEFIALGLEFGAVGFYLEEQEFAEFSGESSMGAPAWA